MMKIKLKIFMILAGLLFVSPAHAIEPSEPDMLTFQKTLSDLNRLKPLQNPKLERAEHILRRRILDSRHQVIGKIEDVLISENGDVSSLSVSFDKLRLGDTVFLNYQTLGVSNTSNGYRLGFNKEEIEDLYPTLLANIETASGEVGVISLSSILDRPLMIENGDKIGKITEVLFNQDGNRLDSVYVTVNSSTIHNKGISIPYRVLTSQMDGNSIRMTVSQNTAAAIFKFLE